MATPPLCSRCIIVRRGTCARLSRQLFVTSTQAKALMSVSDRRTKWSWSRSSERRSRLERKSTFLSSLRKAKRSRSTPAPALTWGAHDSVTLGRSAPYSLNPQFCLAFVCVNLRNLRQPWLQRSEDRKAIAQSANPNAAGKLSKVLRAGQREASSLRSSRSLYLLAG